jgi:hypothetical protein
VLDRSNHPEKIRFFATVLKSKNLAIKLEVMGIIARGRTGEARKMIAAMLETSQAISILMPASTAWNHTAN